MLFHFSDIRALWRSVVSARVPECQKIKNGGFNQYGPEHFEVWTFDTTGLDRVKVNVPATEGLAPDVHALYL